MRRESELQESPGQIAESNQIVDDHETVRDMAEKNEEFRCVEEKSCVDQPAEGVDQHKTSVQKPQQWRNIPLEIREVTSASHFSPHHNGFWKLTFNTHMHSNSPASFPNKSQQ